jgi:hypothetical protein
MEISDVLVARLRALPKRIANQKARTSNKEKHQERNYEVSGVGESFSIYMRQSTLVPNGFSCGSLWLAADGTKTTLARYNGSDHPHRNHIEGTRADH